MDAAVRLWWLPLGAGGRSVGWNGRVYEALAAALARRPRRDLYHAALELTSDGERWVVEMAPQWSPGGAAGGAAVCGPVGLRVLGRWSFFRYEVRVWRDGVIPDLVQAVGGPTSVPTDAARVRRLLAGAGRLPTLTWGRDERGLGEMWTSNSVIAWLLAVSGHDVSALAPPTGGRAPGWSAGLRLARVAGAAG